MRSTRVVSLLALTLAATAFAAPPEGDVLLGLGSGRVSIGLVSEDGLDETPGVRSFYAELGVDAPGFTAEPGWQAHDGTFTPSSTITFTINRALRRWNGSDFSAVAAETLALDFGALHAETPASDVPITGFSLIVDGDGGLHDHPDYTLSNTAATGIWLLDLSFSSSMAGVNPSERVWLLFGQGVTETEADSAYAYATANVPGPGSLGIVGLAGAALVARRRR